MDDKRKNKGNQYNGRIKIASRWKVGKYQDEGTVSRREQGRDTAWSRTGNKWSRQRSIN